jgi:hypothetical protein
VNLWDYFKKDATFAYDVIYLTCMTYKTFLFQLVCFLIPVFGYAKDAKLDSLLNIIDQSMDNSQHYVAIREQHIATLKEQYAAATTDRSRYDIAYNLYEGYKPFVNDSAVFYLNQCIAVASRMNDAQKVNECRAWLALRCSNTGMYDEAQAMLAKVDETALSEWGRGIYYYACAHVYGELAYYTRLSDMRKVYDGKNRHYRDLALETLPKYDNNRFQLLEQSLLTDKKYKQSMALNNEWVKRVEKGSHPYALMAMYRYLEFKNVNDTTQMMQWLAESVLTDITNGVMDQGSMWEMANQLMVMGDVDRAYKYIAFASDCATRFGSRQRLSQISPLLSDIARQYKAESEEYNQRLKMTLGIISVMTLLILASLLYVNRQRKRLAEVGANLSRLNDRLQESNRKLQDANRVKEEYVGRFMRLCSSYVDRLDDFRRKVGRMLKNRQMEELHILTHSTRFKDQELDELYANFDSAFLHLFPNFVESFNELLKPEERVVLDDKLRLNTTVRIFALIRLGIDDSSKIAEFLHYSVNTIYNYRARVKNASLIDRDMFEERVKSIGTAEAASINTVPS